MLNDEQNTGSQKGKQILESIVRALIKLIPVAGEAIDQATFGSKDAIENAELRETIQEIYEMVLAANKQNKGIVKQGVEIILPEILIAPNVPKIISKLDNISTQDLDALTQIIIQLQSSLSETSETITAFKVSVKNIEVQQQQAVAQLKDTKIALQNIENSILERLNKLEELVLKKSLYNMDDLQEIYKELNSLDLSYLEQTSRNLVHASLLIQANKEILWALDTSELIGLAQAPTNVDWHAGFLAFLMQNLEQPLYLLPPTQIELHHFIERMRINLVNGTNIKIANLLKTIRDLFSEGNIILWKEQSHPLYGDSKFEEFFRFIADYRHHNEANTRNDAYVLSQISDYNMMGNEMGKSLGFITRSLVLHRIGENPKFQGLHIGGCPIIVSPYTIAAKVYAVKKNSVTSLLEYSKKPVYVSRVKTKLNEIRIMIDRGAISDLEKVVLEIRDIKRSLFGLTQYAYPFHDEVVNAQIDAYKNEFLGGAIQDFRELYKKLGEDTLSVLSDIESYLKPYRKKNA